MKKIIFILILLIIWLLTLVQQVDASTVTEEINRFLSQCHQYHYFKGSVMVESQGKVIYQNGFGLADRVWKIPVTVKTKFRLGSISKQFTAFLILRLVQEGKLNLHAMVSDYIPEYPAKTGRLITLHHLLCHSSGIPNLGKLKGWFTELWLKEYSDKDFIGLFKNLDLIFEPGSAFSYSNAGYFLLAVIVEKVSGMDFARALKKYIFTPLQMNDSGYYDYYSVVPALAAGYEYWNFHFNHTGYSSPSIRKGSGAVYSTIGDLLIWHRALNSKKLLTKKYYQKMFSHHMPLSTGRHYGYGWVVGTMQVDDDYRDISFMEHAGGGPGVNTLICRLEGGKKLIVLLSNVSQSRIRFMKEQLVNIIYGGSYFVAKPLSMALAQCRTTGEIKTLLKNYQAEPEKYHLKRDAINGVGFGFIRRKQTARGLAVLEFNVRQFPDTPFVYESLAEACLMAGKRDRALINLNQLLKLAPRSRYARKKLAELRQKGAEK